VFDRIGSDKKLTKTILKRQQVYLGHVMKRDGLENLGVTESVKGEEYVDDSRKSTWTKFVDQWMSEKDSLRELLLLLVTKYHLQRTSIDVNINL